MNEFFFNKRDFSKLIAQSGAMFKIIKELKKEDFFGTSPPSVFVGSRLYPQANVGILSPPAETENAWIHDAPNFWAQENYSIKQIAMLRTILINSRFQVNIKDARKQEKFLDIAKEIGTASRPVDVEIKLNKIPEINFDFERILMPMGPRASLKQITITENVKVDNKVEKVVNDVDLKSAEALNYLYENGFDENTLTKLLSIGVLGLKKNRKLVPTKWSIVASIDTISKNLINNIKEFNSIDNYKLFIGNYLGNYYYIVLLPDVWSYEIFEAFMPGSNWNFTGKTEATTDYEDYYGRKNYASNTAGGYYKPRFKILEYLMSIKKQASCLVIRFETPEYSMPLGVWVCGAAAKKALENNALEFNSLNDILNYVKNEIIKKFNFDVENFFKHSKLIRNFKTQTKLNHFVT